MAKRIWKFIGGPKSARTSLNAAVAATIENHEGEVAIFNSETGQVFDRAGSSLPLVLSHQYGKIVDILALILVHARNEEPVPAVTMAGLITQIGGKPVEHAAARARDIMALLRRTAPHEAPHEQGPGSGRLGDGDTVSNDPTS
jgi:hypothetical protein